MTASETLYFSEVSRGELGMLNGNEDGDFDTITILV